MKYIKHYLIVYLLKISLPLIIHTIALNVLSQSDRTMLSALRNTSETGVYSLVYNFSMIATVLVSTMESIWIPWFSRKIKEKLLFFLYEIQSFLPTIIFAQFPGFSIDEKQDLL